MGKPLSWPWLAAVTVGAVGLGVYFHFKVDSTWLEVAAFVTAVMAVYLCAVEQVVNWPISIVSVLLWGYVAFASHLLADATLQLVYVALSIHGWISWAAKSEGQPRLGISRVKPVWWIPIVAFFLVGVAVYTPLIRLWKGEQSLLDTSLFVASLIAQLLQNRKLIENWVLWVVIDGAYIVLYVNQKLLLFAVLSGILVALAIFGLTDWNKALVGKKSKPLESPG